MFGRKKMYKKGLADAMKAYEAFGKKQEAAIDKIVQDFRSSNKELDARLKSLGEDIMLVYDYLDRQEKDALYKLCTPMDLRDLEGAERRLLLAILYQLADDEGSRYNSEQRKFINSIRKYLEITNIQTTADYEAIEEIDSLDVQETFMRVCLEFMYLQESDEMSDDQEEFFDNFSVSKRQARLIEFEVIRQFHLLGVEGMTEKYGNECVYDSFPIAKNETAVEISNNIELSSFTDKAVEPYIGVPLDIATKIASLHNPSYCETKDYVIADQNCYNKHTKELRKYEYSHDTACYEEDLIVFERNGVLEIVDLADNKCTIWAIKGDKMEQIISDDDCEIFSLIIEEEIKPLFAKKVLCNEKWIIIIDQYGTYVINRNDMSIYEMYDGAGKTIEFNCTHNGLGLKNMESVSNFKKPCVLLEDYFYFSSDCGDKVTCEDGSALGNSTLGVFDLSSKKLNRSDLYYDGSEIFVRNNQLYILEKYPPNLKKILRSESGYDSEECTSYTFSRDSKMKLYQNWLLVVDGEENGDFPIYAYYFENEEWSKVATGCYRRRNENNNLFSGLARGANQNKKWEYSASEKIYMIGQWLYFTQETWDWADKDSAVTYRVNVENPGKPVII